MVDGDDEDMAVADGDADDNVEGLSLTLAIFSDPAVNCCDELLLRVPRTGACARACVVENTRLRACVGKKVRLKYGDDKNLSLLSMTSFRSQANARGLCGAN